MRTLRCQILIDEQDIAAIERWLETRDMLVPEAAVDILRCTAVQARVMAPRRQDSTAEITESSK
jgi:hypothetical protein